MQPFSGQWVRLWKKYFQPYFNFLLNRLQNIVVVSSDKVFSSENLEINHLALPLCRQVKEITRNMAEKRVEVITNKVTMINLTENDFIMAITIAELCM